MFLVWLTSCHSAHFFTAVADCDYVLFAYTENHTQAAVQALFGNFHGYLQRDASNVYDMLDLTLAQHGNL